MLILDTDHLSEIGRGLPGTGARPSSRRGTMRASTKWSGWAQRFGRRIAKWLAPMLILDTEHLTEIGHGLPAGERLLQRLSASREEIATTIISAEEQLRGWLAQIKRPAGPHREITAYQCLQERLAFFAEWNVLPWTPEAADIFERLRASGVNIGTMDLKIASIALSRNATLLTRNLRDFQQVPHLRAEDWL